MRKLHSSFYLTQNGPKIVHFVCLFFYFFHLVIFRRIIVLLVFYVGQSFRSCVIVKDGLSTDHVLGLSVQYLRDELINEVDLQPIG